MAKQFPMPCIREDATGWIVQINDHCQIPVKTRDEGINWIETRPVTQKVYAQVPGTKRFELVKEEFDPDEILDD